MRLVMFAFVVLVSRHAFAQVPELVPQGSTNGLPYTYHVSFGGDGKWLAEAHRGGVRIFDVASGRIARQLGSFGPGDALGMATFAAHPHADMLVMCGPGGVVLAYSVTTGKVLWRTAPIAALASGSTSLLSRADLRFSSNGDVVNVTLSMIALRRNRMTETVYARQISTRDGRIELDSPPVQNTLTEPSSVGPQLSRPVLSDDGAWVHVTRTDKTQARARVRDARSGRDVGPEHNGLIVASHAAANRLLLTAPANPLITMVEGTTGRVIREWIGRSASFSGDGSRLLILQGTPLTPASWMVVDSVAGDVIASASRDTPLTMSWAMSPDGKSVATVQQNRLIVSDLSSPITYRVLGQGPFTLVTDSDMEAVQRQELSQERLAELQRAMRTSPPTPAAAFTADGRWLVARADDGRIDVWDTATGNRMPFRLAQPQRESGPLVVRVNDAQTPGAPGGVWQPIQVDAQGTWSERMRSGVPGASGCPTTSYCPVRDTSCAVLGSAPYESLLDASVDPQWGGCSASPDDTRVVVAGTEKRGKRLSRSLVCVLALKCKARVVVFNVAKKTSVPLRDGTRGVAEFPFTAATVEWSPDGAFLMIRDVGRVRLWDAASGNEIDLGGIGEKSTQAVGFMPRSARLVTTRFLSPGSRQLDVWDIRTRQHLLELADVPLGDESSYGVTGGVSDIAANDRAVIGPGLNGELWIRSWQTGEVLGELRVLQNGDWLVTTPSGLFDGSPGGWRQLAWRVGETAGVEPGELYFNEFYQPGLLAELLNGRAQRQVRPVGQRDRRQPVVALSGQPGPGRSAAIQVDVREAAASGAVVTGSGVRDVRLFRNGVLVKVWRDSQALTGGRVTLETTVPLVAGVNRFVAYAFNADNIKSADAELSLVSNATPREPRTFVLAIGVNQYANQEFNLNYAVPDARVFASEFARAQRTVRRTDVRVATLFDSDATRENILFALARLAGMQEGPLPPGVPQGLAALERAEPEDTVSVYFAGHGVANDDRFHLIPADLTYRGARAEARAALSQLLERSISDRDLERAFEPVDARHLLLVIDACNSGQALASDEARFGPMNSRGLAQLAYEKGMFILTASQAYQAALESAQLGHGYLTYALVNEGLNGRVADVTPEDGNVTALEWFDYTVARVPQLQLDAMKRASHAGRLLTFAPTGTSTTGELQTPRVFSRRDADDSLVVARPVSPP